MGRHTVAVFPDPNGSGSGSGGAIAIAHAPSLCCTYDDAERFQSHTGATSSTAVVPIYK